MTIKTKTLKYILYIEGVQVPVQNIQFNNVMGQGCTLAASIPPHPMSYHFKRGMYVQLFKRVNDKEGVLRFSGILMNKVYGKSGSGRELRIECASPEIRLSSIKVCEMNGGQIAMMTKATLRGITHLENALKNMNVTTMNSFLDLMSKDDGSSILQLNYVANLDKDMHDKNQEGNYVRTHWKEGTRNLSGKYATSDETEKKEILKRCSQLSKLLATDSSFQDERRNAALISVKSVLREYERAYTTIAKSTGEQDTTAKLKEQINKLKEELGSYEDSWFIDEAKESLKKEKDEKEKELNRLNKVLIEPVENAKKNMEMSFNENFKIAVGNDAEYASLQDMDFKTVCDYAEANAGFEMAKNNTGAKASKAIQGYINTSNFSLGNINRVTNVSAQGPFSTLVTNVSTKPDNGSTETKSGGEYMQETRQTLSRIYTGLVNTCGGDYFKALVKLIEHIYSESNEPIISEEAAHFKLYDPYDQVNHCLHSLGVVNAAAFAKAESGYSVNQNTGISYKTMAFTIAQTIAEIINSSGAGVPVMNIVQQALSAFMASYSVVHTQFYNSIVIHPLMCNYFPPRRNVIFPNMMTSVQYNANDWANPTRTYMIYDSYLLPQQYNGFGMEKAALASQIAIAPKESRQLRYIDYSALQQTKLVSEKEEKLMNDSVESNSNENSSSDKSSAEQNYNKAFDNNFKSRVEAFKLINSHFSDEEWEIGRTINVVNYGLGKQLKSSSENQVAMADMYHGLAKYGCRGCTVTGGDELDDLVVGMPIVVLDHTYSIYGIVESLSFTVMGEGNVQASVNITMPRMPLLNRYDTLTHAGLWFDNDVSAPGAIGEAYKEVLETDQSFLDECKASSSTDDPDQTDMENKLVDPGLIVDKPGMDDDTVLLKLCLARLNNKYIAASDKVDFVNNFRGVKEDTENSELSILMRSGNPRAGEVVDYLQSLGITDNDSHKYACVTPDSLSYDDMGYISINVEATGYDRDYESQSFEESYDYNISEVSEEDEKRIRNNLNGLEIKSLNKPIKGATVTSAFGWRKHPKLKDKDGNPITKFHKGIDISIGVSGNRIGTSISSVADGIVTEVGDTGASGYGKYVKIDHGNGFSTLYAHCNTINVKKGQVVSSGLKIAGMGNTGTTNKSEKNDGAHLHFEVRKKNSETGVEERVDPELYLK